MQIKTFVVAAVASLGFFVQSTVALTRSEALQNRLTALNGQPAYDGSTTDRERKCNEISGSGIVTKSGLYSEWNSVFTGVATSFDTAVKAFVVRVDFTCKQKQQKKAGCGGYVEDTNYNNHVGKLTIYVGVEDLDPEGSSKRFFIRQDPPIAREGAGLCGAGLAETVKNVIKKMVSVLSKRTPRPDWAAIYFVSPSAEVLQAIGRDFTPGQELYRKAYICLTSRVSDEVFGVFGNSPAKPFTESFTELTLDFYPMESRVFHTNDPAATHTLYGSSTMADLDDIITTSSQKLRNVLYTLNELPLIKYHDPLGTNECLGARFANMLQLEMESLKREHPSFPVPGRYDHQGPSTVIVVERGFDVVTPLVHSFGYQAVVHDLKDEEVRSEVVDGVKKRVVDVSGGKSKESGMVVLDETDELYTKIRHMFFADAIQKIKEAVTEFAAKTNPGAQATADAIDTLRTNILNVNDLKRQKDQLDAIFHFTTELNETMVKKGWVKDLCFLEQTVAVGEDENGQKPKNLLGELKEVMASDLIEAEDKIRLLAIYVLTMGLSTQERDKLLESTGMNDVGASVLKGFNYFGISLDDYLSSPYTKQNRKNKTSSVAPGTTSKGWAEYLGVSSLTGVVAPTSVKPVEEKESQPPPLDRYKPSIHYVLQDHLEGCLNFSTASSSHDTNALSYKKSDVRKPGDTARGPGVVLDFKSGFRPKWATKKAHAEGLEDYRPNGPLTIVFFLGGVTYPEIRTVYQLAKEYKREIVVGATHILTPDDFVDILRYLSNRTDPPLLKELTKDLPAPPPTQSQSIPSQPVGGSMPGLDSRSKSNETSQSTGNLGNPHRLSHAETTPELHVNLQASNNSVSNPVVQSRPSSMYLNDAPPKMAVSASAGSQQPGAPSRPSSMYAAPPQMTFTSSSGSQQTSNVVHAAKLPAKGPIVLGSSTSSPAPAIQAAAPKEPEYTSNVPSYIPHDPSTPPQNHNPNIPTANYEPAQLLSENTSAPPKRASFIAPAYVPPSTLFQTVSTPAYPSPSMNVTHAAPNSEASSVSSQSSSVVAQSGNVMSSQTVGGQKYTEPPGPPPNFAQQSYAQHATLANLQSHPQNSGFQKAPASPYLTGQQYHQPSFSHPHGPPPSQQQQQQIPPYSHPVAATAHVYAQPPGPPPATQQPPPPIQVSTYTAPQYNSPAQNTPPQSYQQAQAASYAQHAPYANSNNNPPKKVLKSPYMFTETLPTRPEHVSTSPPGSQWGSAVSSATTGSPYYTSPAQGAYPNSPPQSYPPPSHSAGYNYNAPQPYTSSPHYNAPYTPPRPSNMYIPPAGTSVVGGAYYQTQYQPPQQPQPTYVIPSGGFQIVSNTSKPSVKPAVNNNAPPNTAHLQDGFSKTSMAPTPTAVPHIPSRPKPGHPDTPPITVSGGAYKSTKQIQEEYKARKKASERK
ncbi:vacuolar sorting protein VPS33/slp1 [Chytridiales sp. JEL 0842]|nr:vacuolar sorting protein VPS33/slp1 [Chytridiales sp. JEL 0842]